MKKQRQCLDSTVTTAECKNCPYPSTGFLCGGSDGECMKTRMQKIKNTSKKEEYAND